MVDLYLVSSMQVQLHLGLCLFEGICFVFLRTFTTTSKYRKKLAFKLLNLGSLKKPTLFLIATQFIFAVEKILQTSINVFYSDPQLWESTGIGDVDWKPTTSLKNEDEAHFSC